MKDQTNVIQFPKPQPPSPSSSNPRPSAQGAANKKFQWNPGLATTVCSMIAIALATGATNTNLFQKPENIVEMASLSQRDRGIASVEETLPEDRDAAWEKSVAESLASSDVRDVASISIGHEASLDESVRYGVLERKYTILRDLKRNEIESIILQGSGSEPSTVSNRAAFLGKYGKWLTDKYSFSELKSSEADKDRRTESFTIFDVNHHAYAIAKFELDNYQRLLAFHLEPL